MVLKAIKELRPNKIILLGRVALESFLGHRTDKLGSLGRWLGAAIPDQDVNAWVFPTNHPSYILRLQGSDPVVDRLFREDLERAFSWDKPFPYSDRPETGVHVLSTPEEAKNYLPKIYKTLDKLVKVDFIKSGKVNRLKSRLTKKLVIK